MTDFSRIFLLKLPYCPHPDATSALSKETNYRIKVPFRPFPSLALAVICSFVEKYKSCDYALKAIDLNIEAYTDPLTPIDVSVYPELLKRCLEQNDYDVLALSATFVSDYRWVEDAVEISKKYHPRAKIILGGGYPTIFPERALIKHDVDDVIIGEGEHTLLHILNRYNGLRDLELEERFPFEGHATKDKNGNITYAPEKKFFLEGKDIPPAAWHFLDINKYFKNSGDDRLPIEASRGCPYHCSFCCGYLTWGRKTRCKVIDNLISEIKGVSDDYDGAGIHFIDDNMNLSKTWMEEFLNRMIDENLIMKMYASNFNIKHLDEEVIALLEKAGVRQLGIAVETASPEMQKFIRKNLNMDRVRKIVKILQKRKFHIHICWMVGFPNESIDQINDTFDLVREFRGNTNSFSIVLPYPGTRLFEDTKAMGALANPDNYLDKFDNRSCDHIKSNEWDYEMLQEMIYDINIEVNFLNNRAMDTEDGREYFHEYLCTFLKRMPDHVIGHIIVGYLYRLKNDKKTGAEHYERAMELLKEPVLKSTFTKYLSWDQMIITDFNEYRAPRRDPTLEEGERALSN